jgi:hypothetical protein
MGDILRAIGFVIGSLILRVLGGLLGYGTPSILKVLAMTAAVADIGALAWIFQVARKKTRLAYIACALIALPVAVDLVVAANIGYHVLKDSARAAGQQQQAETAAATITVSAYSEELIRLPGLSRPVGLRMIVTVTPGQDLSGDPLAPLLYHVPAGAYRPTDIFTLAERMPGNGVSVSAQTGDNMRAGYFDAQGGMGGDLPALHGAGESIYEVPTRLTAAGRAMTYELASPGILQLKTAPLKICAARKAPARAQETGALVARWPLRNGVTYADAGTVLAAALHGRHSLVEDPAQWSALLQDLTSADLSQAGFRPCNGDFVSLISDCYCGAPGGAPQKP